MIPCPFGAVVASQAGLEEATRQWHDVQKIKAACCALFCKRLSIVHCADMPRASVRGHKQIRAMQRRQCFWRTACVGSLCRGQHGPTLRDMRRRSRALQVGQLQSVLSVRSEYWRRRGEVCSTGAARIAHRPRVVELPRPCCHASATVRCRRLVCGGLPLRLVVCLARAAPLAVISYIANESGTASTTR